MSLVVTADDFGLCPEIDEAICQLHDAGMVARTSLLVNGGSFNESIAALRQRPTLDVAIHLNLTDGRPVLPASEVPSLVGSDGRFRGSSHVATALSLAVGRTRAAEVYREWRAQIARARDAGVTFTELNAHGHLHLLPTLHTVVLRLRREFNVPRVRLVRSPEWPKGLVLAACSARLAPRLRADGVDTRMPSRTLGLKDSGGVDPGLDLTAIADEAVDTELIVHPATGPNPYHAQWGYDGAAVTAWLLGSGRRLIA